MSLRLRLGLWYGVLTGVVMLLASLFIYVVHSRGQYDDLDRALVGAATQLAGEYVTMPAVATMPRMLAVPIAPAIAVRIYGANGRLIVEAPGVPQAPLVPPRTVLAHPSPPPSDPLVGLVPWQSAVAAGQGAFGLVTGRDGTRWRAYALPMPGSRRDLVLLASLASIDASVDAFRGLLLLATAGGALVTFAAGWLLARRALRPVALLTATASAIARSRGFERRVPVGNRRDELDQLAITFNEMLTSLEQAYLTQQRFVADASHELRAPLTAIQANLELLEHQPALAPDDRREAVQEASREAQRLATLVGDLLTLARADAGLPVRRRRVELDRVLLEALSAARHLVQGQQIAVDRLEPALVSGDPDRLKQLLLILLDNAGKYTPQDGRIAASLVREGDWACVAIADTGIGIPPGDLPHVFERFYRADPARSREAGGTGLGLSIAQWIVVQHGGRIDLQSAAGRGTTVTVRLPLAP